MRCALAIDLMTVWVLGSPKFRDILPQCLYVCVLCPDKSECQTSLDILQRHNINFELVPHSVSFEVILKNVSDFFRKKEKDAEIKFLFISQDRQRKSEALQLGIKSIGWVQSVPAIESWASIKNGNVIRAQEVATARRNNATQTLLRSYARPENPKLSSPCSLM